MRKQFKFLPLYVLLVLLTGCANGSPLDILIPTRKPTIATSEYLGHLYGTNNVNGMYHSLSDTKFEKAMVPLRDAELRGLKIVAQGELGFIDAIGTATSNGIWGAVVMGAGLLGWQIPRPQEKGKVVDALHATPPNATS